MKTNTNTTNTNNKQSKPSNAIKQTTIEPNHQPQPPTINTTTHSSSKFRSSQQTNIQSTRAPLPTVIPNLQADHINQTNNSNIGTMKSTFRSLSRTMATMMAMMLTVGMLLPELHCFNQHRFAQPQQDYHQSNRLQSWLAHAHTLYPPSLSVITAESFNWLNITNMGVIPQCNSPLNSYPIFR